MNLFRRVISFPKRRPVLFGCGLSCVKTVAADLVVQKYVENRKEIDMRRSSIFGIFGLVYMGGWQYFLYVKAYPRIFPAAQGILKQSIRAKMRNRAGQIAVVKQVACEMLVTSTLLYFPFFYIAKEVVEGGDPRHGVKNGLRNYWNNFSSDMPGYWAIWTPAFTINFALIPMWGKIPFIACVSFAWTMVLSAMRGAPLDRVETAEETMSLEFNDPGKNRVYSILNTASAQAEHGDTLMSSSMPVTFTSGTVAATATSIKPLQSSVCRVCPNATSCGCNL